MKVAVVLLAAGCAQNTGPHLASVTPSFVYNATTMNVTIDGERMCAGDCAHAAGEIALEYDDGVVLQLSIVSFADTSAQVAIPGGAPTGTCSIVLTVNGSSSNALPFSVMRATGGVLP